MFCKFISTIFIFLLVGIITTNAVSTKESSTYIAAVVEYNPVLGKNAFDLVSRNLAEYLKYISQAKKQNVDIIVFPEATLNRDVLNKDATEKTAASIEVPHGDEKANPCEEKDKYSKILVELSCAAQLESMYVVVNVGEMAFCNQTVGTVCNSNKTTIYFNTNVVFDRDGVIISRYRKINLFGEYGFSPSINRELGVFDTDFGVKFGHFICFDLMFQVPAVQTVEKLGIQNVIFPTMWFSEMPFLTGVQIHEGYAFTHNVNFLAAGANNPWIGSTGTGIYSGRNGTLVAVMNGVNKSQMLVAEVPKIPGTMKITNQTPKTRQTENLANSPATMDALYLKRDQLDAYASQPLDEVKEHQFINLTHNNIECHFHISLNSTMLGAKLNTTQHYKYRAMAYDGMRTFDGVADGGVINCALIACYNDSLSSCGKRFPSYSSFKPIYQITRLEIAAMVPIPDKNVSLSASNIVYHPVTLDTTIMPIGTNNYEMYKVTIEGSSSHQLLKMTLKEPQTELLTFGIFGRHFSVDPRSHKSSAAVQASSFWIICIWIVSYFMLIKN